ncbi:MAG TPA: S8 family serine peptidase, partial [Pyrinomonadaceae bacterium]|nr:S8 family serine peptidase [Pyrinomonadaceae bacterium]
MAGGKTKAQPLHPTAQQVKIKSKIADTSTEKFAALSRYTNDLTSRARQHEITSVAAFETEIDDAIKTLSRSSKNNPVLVGGGDFDRISVVEGIARKIADGEVPQNLRGRRVISLDVLKILEDAKSPAGMEQTLNALLTEITSAATPSILFIDEILFTGADAAHGATASAALRSALKRGRLQCIGAANVQHFEQYIESDLALNALFKPVRLDGDDDTSEEASRDEGEEERDWEHEGDKVSLDLREMMNASGSNEERVRVILQVEDTESESFNATLSRAGVQVTESIRQFGSLAVELPVRAVEELAANTETRYISLDRELVSLGHIETTTGAAAARTLNTRTRYDGTGIGIAVLDSSVFGSHWSFLGKDGNKRVTSVDFGISNQGSVNLGPTDDDPFGHGTHVASMAVGNTDVDKYESSVRGKYTGVAPNAYVYNLRVLDEQGRGTTSGVLKALDWILKNHKIVVPNIRVVNLSLGAPAIDS